MNMKDQKFSIEFKTTYECYRAQELLLDLGFKWIGGGGGVIDTGRTRGVLSVKDGLIRQSDGIHPEYRPYPMFKISDIRYIRKHPRKGILFGRVGMTSFLVDKNYVYIEGVAISHRDLVKITYEMDKFLGEDGELMTDRMQEPPAPVRQSDPRPTLNAPTQRIVRTNQDGTQWIDGTQWVEPIPPTPPNWIVNNPIGNVNTTIWQLLNEAAAAQGGVAGGPIDGDVGPLGQVGTNGIDDAEEDT